MNILSLTTMEFYKIKRSKILLLLTVPLIILWLPNVINAHMNAEPVMEGISPANNFLIQSFMGYVWFILPASIIVCTVMLQQMERTNRGILKMLALPLHPSALSLSKFSVLLSLTALQCALMTGCYLLCSRIASVYTGADLTSPLRTALPLAVSVFLSALPMTALYWTLAVILKTPVFSMVLGLATMVPSVLFINTKVWFLYPTCYPFYVITQKYGQLAGDTAQKIDLLPWIPAAASIFILCLLLSCLFFGHGEKKH